VHFIFFYFYFDTKNNMANPTKADVYWEDALKRNKDEVAIRCQRALELYNTNIGPNEANTICDLLYLRRIECYDGIVDWRTTVVSRLNILMSKIFCGVQMPELMNICNPQIDGVWTLQPMEDLFSRVVQSVKYTESTILPYKNTYGLYNLEHISCFNQLLFLGDPRTYNSVEDWRQKAYDRLNKMKDKFTEKFKQEVQLKLPAGSNDDLNEDIEKAIEVELKQFPFIFRPEAFIGAFSLNPGEKHEQDSEWLEKWKQEKRKEMKHEIRDFEKKKSTKPKLSIW